MAVAPWLSRTIRHGITWHRPLLFTSFIFCRRSFNATLCSCVYWDSGACFSCAYSARRSYHWLRLWCSMSTEMGKTMSVLLHIQARCSSKHPRTTIEPLIPDEHLLWDDSNGVSLAKLDLRYQESHQYLSFIFLSIAKSTRSLSNPSRQSSKTIYGRKPFPVTLRSMRHKSQTWAHL